jgi:ankyrin repeat protein
MFNEISNSTKPENFNSIGETTSKDICKSVLNAIKNKDEEKLKELIEKHPQLADYSDDGGHTLTMYAVIEGNESLLTSLIKFGITSQRPSENNNNMSPLHCAVFKNNGDIVNVLLEDKNTVVNTKDSFGFTPLQLGVMHQRFIAVKKLLVREDIGINEKIDGKWPLLQCAIEKANDKEGEELVLSLLKHPSININSTDSEGIESIYYAANKGLMKVVRALLEMKQSNGLTECIFACINKDYVGALILADCVPILELLNFDFYTYIQSNPENDKDVGVMCVMLRVIGIACDELFTSGEIKILEIKEQFLSNFSKLSDDLIACVLAGMVYKPPSFLPETHPSLQNIFDLSCSGISDISEQRKKNIYKKTLGILKNVNGHGPDLNYDFTQGIGNFSVGFKILPDTKEEYETLSQMTKDMLQIIGFEVPS